MPREKMICKGASALSNTELLAILLRTGRGGMNVIDMARELLQSGDGSLNGIAGMSLERLKAISGIGPGKAVTIAAAFELGRRVNIETAENCCEHISSAKKVFRIMQPIMKDLDHEECWVIFLNKANRFIGKEMISRGGLDSTIIDNRSIIRKAIDRKATGLILVHNHPSGNRIPGETDKLQTIKLKNGAAVCEIQLVDHIIVAGNDYFSFADEGLL
jgi:DNA repair protein RadC